MIHLGVDIASMDTVSRSSDGIELALARMGKAICDKARTVGS